MKLRNLNCKDVNGMLEWMHDPEVNQYFRFDPSGMNEKKVLEFIEEANQLACENKALHLAIANDEDEYLGTISLKDINFTTRSAEYAISLRRKAQGQGVATKATKEILRKAFEELKLNRVYLNVLSRNYAAIHLYEKCGFVYEGEFREHLDIRGCIESLKWYGILLSDYNKVKEDK